jgi:hypothetical protein
MSGKRRKTCLKRYGVENPMQNREIYLKTQRSGKHQGQLPYWKTGEMVPWNRSYERKTIEYFNNNKREFKWQIEFGMPDGKKYFCDFYLIKEDLYIEVKGIFRKDAQEKWEWFQREHTNSILWDKKELKQRGIL